jgi:hypothetical protein
MDKTSCIFTSVIAATIGTLIVKYNPVNDEDPSANQPTVGIIPIPVEVKK